MNFSNLQSATSCRKKGTLKFRKLSLIYIGREHRDEISLAALFNGACSNGPSITGQYAARDGRNEMTQDLLLRTLDTVQWFPFCFCDYSKIFSLIKPEFKQELMRVWCLTDLPFQFSSFHDSSYDSSRSTKVINDESCITYYLVAMIKTWVTFKYPRSGSSFLITTAGHDIAYQVSYYR
jgi:hypothetical protein